MLHFRFSGKEEKRKRKDAKVLKQLEKQRRKEEETKEQLRQESERKEKGDVTWKVGCGNICRPYTVSIALPGSVMDNAQSPELRTYLAGQIARASAVFSVDEVVIFDEQGEESKTVEGEFKGVGKKGQACVQLARILQYLECPQYLRKSFFPKHQDLQFAGLLNPLDSPHHMRVDEEAEFREGVVLDRPSKPGKGSFVNCGMRKEVQIDKLLQAGLRVTVRLRKTQKTALQSCALLHSTDSRFYKGVVVAPHVPRTEGGLYWGYSVRLASCLSNVFAECPHKEGYDLTIGTSERGSNIDLVTLSPFKRLLIVFGGLQGLEASVDFDQNLDITDPSVLFDHYINTCPNQGSRTIRTEVKYLGKRASSKILSLNNAGEV
ncbi:hypothetical protein Z043_118753 [Scleropages formosus]|uniref:28S rRNA (uridine-N(3))-methyltransferase n=1 Tax=Scleropages formosus TaxID=113540 RepID=A0A0N8JX83_SCLFO|nr:hypothetical protein Z043_118753 [Scleropages formosus]